MYVSHRRYLPRNDLKSSDQLYVLFQVDLVEVIL